MAGVEAERDGGAVGGAQAAVGAEDEDFGAEECVRFPAHAGVLGQAEEIAGGRGEEHLGGDGESAGGAGRVGGDAAEAKSALSRTDVSDMS